MSRIVQKFGGTSLADVERIKNVARRVRREVDAGNEVAVVVSAMAGVTNQLVDWTRQSSLVHDAREYDVVVSSGEQVTAGLLALALQDLRIDARSWLGWQMLEMASQGARVLETRSVELAMNHRVRVHVRSSFTDAAGTLLVDEDEIVEQQVVSGIAYSRDEAKITVQKVADRPGVAAAIFGPLADNAINVDMIVQSASEDGHTADLTFTVAQMDLDRAVSVLEQSRAELGYAALKPDSNVVKISVIGVGMRSHAGVAKQMFRTLADKGINIQVISTSEIKVSVLIAAEYTELALRALHTAYGLDAPG